MGSMNRHFREADSDVLEGRLLATAPEGEETAFSRVEGPLYVKEQSLQAAHAEIIERHGSMAAFLTEGLGCSKDSLRRLRDDLLE